MENADFYGTKKQEIEEWIMALQFHNKLLMISSKLPII
jgi:hypothetical protein